jgi:hypothetical protein
METGIISETKINKTRQMELISWVFASANSCEKVIQPLLSRFVVLEIPEYTFDEFTDIAISRLSKEILMNGMPELLLKRFGTKLVQGTLEML